jgi:hypothetical protein
MIDFPKGRLSLYLIDLSEPETNSLRAVVAVAGATGEDTPISDTGLFGKAILPTGVRYEFYWDRYVAYSVRDESFAQFDKDRPPSDSQFTERTSSAYLKFVTETTFAASVADQIFKAPIRHWELTCLDHFLDVVSATPPIIRKGLAAEILVRE